MTAGNQRSVAFAKTTRPAIGSIVPRPRLFARLDGNAGRTVAWISGPPGSGKTSLAASYVEARRHRVLWYQLDPDDADVATFLHYLRHAARKLDGEHAAQLPAYSPQQEPDIASFSRRFFRQLFAGAKGGFALVLDNLHAVPAGSGLHVAIEAALHQVPKNCCVIVTSRSEPPASLARLRVTADMVSVGAGDLRIEAPELAEIAKARGKELAPEAAALLEERTQGWAAGVVLMLEHAKLAGRIADFPGDAAPKAIFDYLAGEIFDRFEPKTRQFLLRVACLPRMTGPVAEALSGEPKAARLLLNLALNDYFVKEVQAEEGRIFELHPLMRDFLRSRAAQELPEALEAPQLKRAAALLCEAGHVEDAVALLIECRDWSEMARIAAEVAEPMLSQGRSDTLGGWLELLPPEALESDPTLLRALAACRSRSSPRAARRLFEKAFEASQSAGDAAGMLKSCCGIVEAAVLEFDDLTVLDRWRGVLAQLLGGSASLTAQHPAALATLIRAFLLRDPGSPDLARWLALAERAATAADSSELRAQLTLARAGAALLRGEIDAAGALIDALAAESDELPAAVTAAIGVAAALHQLLAGAHERALGAARLALSRFHAEGVHAYDGWLRAIAAAAAFGAGDLDAGRSELQQFEAAGTPRRGDRAALHLLQGWLAALDADSGAAQRQLKSAISLAVEAGMPWLECLAHIAAAEVLAEADDRRGTESQLRAASELAGRLDSDMLRYGATLAAANAARRSPDPTAAVALVGEAFALARERGFVQTPLWRADAVAELCVLALRHGIEPEFARSLVRSCRLMPRAAPLRVRDWPWPVRISLLGRFELLRGNAPIELAAKGPGRPMELLKVLLALGAEGSRAEQLADALWPHVDADYAHKSFTATLHRLRRLLGEEEALVLRDGRLRLNPALIWVDAWALEQTLDQLDETLRVPQAAAADAAARSLADEALALYRGPFLPDEAEQPSYLACREHIRARLMRCLTRVARRMEEAGQADAAADCYARCIGSDPLFEAPYRNLMLCLQRSGEHAEARATYERLSTMLAAKLKTRPSAETQAVFAALASP